MKFEKRISKLKMLDLDFNRKLQSFDITGLHFFVKVYEKGSTPKLGRRNLFRK